MSRTLGERLKELRKKENLSQQQMAVLLGVGQTAIVNYESGKRFPKEKTLIFYAEHFSVSLDWIFGLSNKTK